MSWRIVGLRKGGVPDQNVRALPGRQKPEGEEFDKNKVNVEYQPGDGSEPITVLKVASPDECGDGGGWYYDDEADPHEVRTCPATCDVLTADPAGSIGILFGCETQVDIPE